MQPNDHISIAVEYSFAPNSSSGALYYKEQTMSRHCICENVKSNRDVKMHGAFEKSYAG